MNLLNIQSMVPPPASNRAQANASLSQWANARGVEVSPREPTKEAAQESERLISLLKRESEIRHFLNTTFEPVDGEVHDELDEVCAMIAEFEGVTR